MCTAEWPRLGKGLESTHREEVKRDPLTPPNVDRATEIGMIQAMTPRSFSPKVCETKQGVSEKGEVTTSHLWVTAGNAPSQAQLVGFVAKLLRGQMTSVP